MLKAKYITEIKTDSGWKTIAICVSGKFRRTQQYRMKIRDAVGALDITRETIKTVRN